MPWSGFNYKARPNYVRSLPGGKWQYEDHTAGWHDPMYMFTDTGQHTARAANNAGTRLTPGFRSPTLEHCIFDTKCIKSAGQEVDP